MQISLSYSDLLKIKTHKIIMSQVNIMNVI